MCFRSNCQHTPYPRANCERAGDADLSAPAEASGAPGTPTSTSSKQGSDFLRGFTISALLDTYYEYNTNSPIG